MPTGDPLVAIIAGGDTAELESSIASGYNVFNELRLRFACILLKLCRGQWSVLDHDAGIVLGPHPTMDPLLRLRCDATGVVVKPDVAVLCTHGYPGETGELQGLLALADIPYCSSGVLASSLAADKYRCSEYLTHTCGANVPRQQRLSSANLTAGQFDTVGWPPPFVLKPISLGSALGIVSVHDRLAIPSALKTASEQGCDYLVEEFIEGREITAGAIRLRDRDILLPAASVSRDDSLNELGIRAYTDHKSVQLHIPADIPDEAVRGVRDNMTAIGDSLDLIGCYRADFIWTGGDLYFLEVNTIPGLGPNSVFTRLAEAAGFTLSDVLEPLIAEALSGHQCRSGTTAGA